MFAGAKGISRQESGCRRQLYGSGRDTAKWQRRRAVSIQQMDADWVYPDRRSQSDPWGE